MKVAVVGTGHVGLPTAAALAHIGHEVIGMDSDSSKIDRLRAGELPFFEPGLDALVREGLASGRLTFTSDPEEAVAGTKVVFLCVGTPPRASGEANLRAVEQTAEMVARHARESLVIVEKSTVPAGTAKRIGGVLKRARAKVDITVVSNPEFLREGKAVEDSLKPARILVGSDDPDAFPIMRELYAPLTDKGALWIETDVQTAELSKHASNAFLAMKISFANALAQLADRTGADVVKIADAMGADPRIGRSFLNAGLGYGGYCFPKDLTAFEHLARQLGYDFGLLREVALINDQILDHVYNKIEEVLWNLEGKRVALLGLAFKADTDDVRLSPALRLAQKLLDEHVEVIGYDPQANATAKEELPDLQIANDAYEALQGAHCAVICTEWDEFRTLDLEQLERTMAVPLLVDARNVLEPETVRSAGITYLPIGRPSA